MTKFKPMPEPDRRETHAELVARLKAGKPPARPLIYRESLERP